MNELVFVKENYNVIHISFLRRGNIQEKAYKWYLPYRDMERVHVGTFTMIKIDDQRKKVFVVALSYDTKAEQLYKIFPLVSSQPSWQVQLICQHLTNNGIKFYRERCFKGLKNGYSRGLQVDVSFQNDNQWCFIEYHGTHHYYKRGASIQRFKNILKNMELKRIWCEEHQVPYLEIPFFRQKEIIHMVDAFLSKTMKK
ncbi:hypothetical protein FH008_15685 [Listeria monocytogenes]|uniref:hypothetical protein n=1 Tax=Listeria TaxID=1637 RepID=UPI0011EA7237|nr:MULTISPECIES: hypothetical protein [Listeria]EBF5116493.1 hypothetical protein [Listeria monocytogenes]EBF5125455.1 hypothetical protein [Listeria monocytogenes]EBF5152560.1 hypothetical protein [Listeria monocytogenes]MBC1339136.1 hypothetical protein [Listeria innocua]TYV02522.1 hypothetical protein FZ054_14130 [Listeria monocytogenes]